MAEKDIKKTPAATQTVQPSADKYTIQELENASTKVFGVPRECAVAAFKGCKKTEMTVAEAKQIIDAKGKLVTESFVNGHLHLCKVYTLEMAGQDALKE